MKKEKIKAIRREIKRKNRTKMPVSGKSVFAIRDIIARKTRIKK